MDWARKMQNRIKKKQKAKKRIVRINQKEDLESNIKYWFILYYGGIRLHKLCTLLKTDFEDDEVWHPVYSVIKYNHRKLVYETRYVPFYPNYVFLKTTLDYIVSEKLQILTSRVRFLKDNNKFYYLNDEEIKVIQEEEMKMKYVDRREEELGYTVGDKVVILNGPFKNCEGEVVFINLKKKKVSVKVFIFGREISLEAEVKDIRLK